ncbi:MAG: antibiotic biosynthesis monooxygenase [Planctomycetota bacterium]|jgi:heme-degrading monooxygenase HmoA|nr:antibiotic biosynthesis monooxygenase [Planctomycetota bacterium]
MITVGMNYHVIDGKQEVFEAAFNKVIAALEAAPGHDNSHLYVDINDKQSYCIVSQWNDEAAFGAFMRSDEFRAVADWGKEEILDQRPRHQIYGQ